MKVILYSLGILASAQVNALKYESTILGENLTYHINNYVSFTIKQQSNEKFAYLTFEQPITASDDLQLMTKVTRQDGVEFQFPDNPSNLCDILNDQMQESKEMMSRFNIPNVFNIIGRTCPIEKSTLRLTPHVFPHFFELKNDLGCGRFNLETSLMKCEPLKKFSKECILLIKADTQLEIFTSHCSNTFE